MEPKLVEWIARQPADVKVKRVPAAFAVRGVDSIPIFYTLEAMGVVEKLHQKLFDAINVENAMLGNAATLNKWLEKQGIDTKKYEEMQKSFSVQNRINRARHMSQDYKITGTPTLVVNGRYSFEQGQGTPERMFAMMDIAIAETRTSLFKSAASPVPPAVKQK